MNYYFFVIMIANLYKVLFEVQLLHEYFLTDPDQSSVFDAANITNATDYVETRQEQGRPSVTDTVQFVVPAATQQVFRNYGLRLINTYSGFKVVIKDSVTLPGDCNIFFLIKAVDETLGAITNGRMRREINSLYYFNNGTVGGAKTAPILSNPIPAKATDASYVYQQGELINNNGNIQFAYYASNNQNAQFGAVSGNGFANESDRMLVGSRFNYTFAATDKVTTASFVLKDVSGATIKTINITAATPLGVVALDFSEDAQGNPLSIQTLPEGKLSDPILYTLAVTGSAAGNTSGSNSGTGYSKTFNLVFYDDDAEFSGAFGLIQLQASVSGASFSLLDANGQLTSPVFQIRLKSLPTFRRYINNTGQAMALAASLTNILVAAPAGNQLSTVLPVPLTYMPYFFVPNQWANAPPAAGGAGAGAVGAGGAAAPAAKGTVYLPAPDPGGTMDLSNNQLSSLILVPVSPLFPLPQAAQAGQAGGVQAAAQAGQVAGVQAGA